MGCDQTGEPIHLNWIVILSSTGSLAVSLALWVGLIRVVQHLVR
jgi:hypothetical protein